MTSKRSSIQGSDPGSFQQLRSDNELQIVTLFCSTHELYIYYPLDSRVKPLQLSNFERQVLFPLSTPPVSKGTYYENI